MIPLPPEIDRLGIDGGRYAVYDDAYAYADAYVWEEERRRRRRRETDGGDGGPT